MVEVGSGVGKVRGECSIMVVDRSSETAGADMEIVGRIGRWALEPNDSPRDQVTGVHMYRLRSS